MCLLELRKKRRNENSINVPLKISVIALGIIVMESFYCHRIVSPKGKEAGRGRQNVRSTILLSKLEKSTFSIWSHAAWCKMN